MNTPRTTPNLLDEATHLTDDSYSYGALILARAIGRAAQLDGIAPHDGLTPNQQARRITQAYGPIVAQACPSNPARRHITLTDAADLAFA